MSTWYLFYQPIPESDWILGLADSRKSIVQNKRPPFTTILDVDQSFEGEVTAEILAAAKYRGPFYIDLDSKDIGVVTEQFQKLLRKLEKDYGVNLNQLALYATGGRGYHIIFNQTMFLTKVPERGLQFLPLIYREMANDLFVDTLDLNIYSTKRGRMFREKNVQRTNGRYKVQITVAEAMAMTEESYIALTSTPRHLEYPASSEYSQEMGLLFAKSQSKILAAVKNRKNRKADDSLLKSFGGKVPPTILGVMNGVGIAEGMGFQSIATQLAITSHALMQTQDVFIEACQGLIDSHVGDSDRYGTPIKRRTELLRMYAYMAENPCYTFSVGGIKSLMVKGTDAPDLDMGVVQASEEAAEGEAKFSISQGIRVTQHGIFKKNDEGLSQVSAMGLTNPKQLLDLNTGEVHGYEVDVTIDGKPSKPKIITMDAFTSRSSFLRFSLSAGSCNIGLTDAQIGALADIMRIRTEKTGQQVYTVRREGIDLVHTPSGEMDIIWADQFGVTSNVGMNYRLTGSMTSDLQFRTDLRHAPELIDTEETKEFFHRLFNINKAETIGRLMGFYTAAFMSQPLRHIFGKLPFLQVYGPAGSGKSDTNRLFARMHYYKQDPMISSALDSTRFLYEEMATCSGSMPFILDEYKPREMRRDIYEKSKGILRSNYNGDSIGKGSLSSSTGQSKLMLTRVSNRSPIVVIGEALISQTALLERCVLVPITKEGKKGHREDFMYCQSHAEVLSMLGRTMIDKVRALDLGGLRAQMEFSMKQVREMVGHKADDNDRPIYNVAVILTGLEFLRRIFIHVFGEEFESEFARLRESVTVSTEHLIPKVVSEASKVLDSLAYLSNYEAEEKYHIKEGEDYIHTEHTIEMRLKNVYTKYVRFKRSQGEEVLYDSYEAFYSAMQGYQGTLDNVCPTSSLKDSPQTAVFAFSKTFLVKENIELFKFH